VESNSMFWGTHGEYGPFSPQADGWPNAGEVVRHYRTAAHMSLTDLARKYGEATKTTVSKQWISQMERSNEVPTDITRRQTLVKILQIPPILLGLGSLEQIRFAGSETISETKIQAPVILKQRASRDLSLYEAQIRAFWLLSETSQAHDVLKDMIISIQQLEELEKQSSGAYQRALRELLYSYYRLVTRVHRDLLNLPTALYYANQTIRVTNCLERKDLLANAFFMRGFVQFIWGLRGKDAAFGIIRPQREKCIKALQDFELAFPLARPQVKGLLQLEMSRLLAHLSSSAIDTTIALKTMDQAEKLVGSSSKRADAYTTIVLDYMANGLDEEGYLLGRAVTFNSLGYHSHALETLDAVDRLDRKKRRSKDQTRHYAWLDVVQARTYLGLKEYYIATDRIINAFLVYEDLDSLTNMAFVHDVYDLLCASPYRENVEVKMLGQMLTNYYETVRRKQP